MMHQEFYIETILFRVQHHISICTAQSFQKLKMYEDMDLLHQYRSVQPISLFHDELMLIDLSWLLPSMERTEYVSMQLYHDQISHNYTDRLFIFPKVSQSFPHKIV